jgi:hypothetical protein
MKRLAIVNINPRLLLFGLIACSLLATGLLVRPQTASAAVCANNGSACDVGYFSRQNVAAGSHHNLYNGNDFTWGGSSVLLGLRPSNVGDLKNLILGRLGCTNNANPPTVMTNPGAQNATAAAFTVLTMLGAPPGSSKNLACQRYPEWAKLMDDYNYAGLIHFSEWKSTDGVNTRLTYSAGTDVSYYTDWEAPSDTSVVFYSPIPGGGILYAIKRDCGNPIGRLRPLVRNFNLSSSITPKVNGAVAAVAEPGDSVNFEYAINNSGTTPSSAANCYGGKLNRPGYHNPINPAESGGVALILSCPRSEFNPGRSVVGIEVPLTATAGMSYCRTLFVTPISQSNNGTNSTEVCINVVSKPYLMVFGGDVSAGGEVESAPGSCTNNSNASIVSWNKNTAGYAGAGVQFAALAMGTIKEFSTAQRSPAGGATMPAGLSFSSTTQSGNKYGGNLGTAKCIKDYYAEKPAATNSVTPPASLSSLGTGDYFANSSLALSGGNINPGQKTTLYVNGDLFISSNITYVGGWSYDKIPLFKVVVRGSIFIGSGVDRLDGVYIAQPLADLTKGNVYTCATDATPPFDEPLNNPGRTAFYSGCSLKKLTVNGSVVARNIQFLRTSGTLRTSTTTEGRTSNGAAEAFNYGPGFWITQPTNSSTDTGRVENYDAITSLPPVL